ncbi:hypothetical protein F6455_04760 [Proteobacteria bacterium 005FR1]|nr:hypothetical protein [Proteobacteria bacterium 005FR1]
MGEALAVFLVLMYDIALTLFVGFLVYCIVAKRVITTTGWAYRRRQPGQYRRRMLGMGLIAALLIVLRVLPLPF